MASALGNWAMKTHTLGAGQFVEFILTREWNEAMKMMRTAEILNEAERRSGKIVRFGL